jgi:hypothetical protein
MLRRLAVQLPLAQRLALRRLALPQPARRLMLRRLVRRLALRRRAQPQALRRVIQ